MSLKWPASITHRPQLHSYTPSRVIISLDIQHVLMPLLTHSLFFINIHWLNDSHSFVKQSFKSNHLNPRKGSQPH